MRPNRRILGALTGLIVLSLVCAGCGKKGDPTPPQIRLPIIADLTVQSRQDGITLGWSLTEYADGTGGFKVFRSATTEGSVACPGCPQEYHPFAMVSLSDDRLKREGDKRFRYLDADVRTGGFYSYRITVCTSAGNCGEASNEAGTIHAGR